MMKDNKVQPGVEGHGSMDWERYYELLRLNETGQPEVALSGLRALLASTEDPEAKPALLFAIGSSLRCLDRTEEAREALSEVYRAVSRSSETFARAIYIDACLDIDDGKWKEALAKLDDLLSSFPDLLKRPEEQDTLGDILRKRGIVLYELRRPKEAWPLLERAATQNEERPAALYYLGRARYDLSDLEGAKQAFREALSLDLHPVYQPSAHYMLGLIHYHQGQHAWAIREYEWCLEHDERRLEPKKKILTALMLAHRALGQEKEAERYSKMLGSE